MEKKMSEAADFEGLSLARLHEAAAGAGIEGFRKMRMEAGAEALAEAGAEPPAAPAPGGGEGRSSSRRRRSRRSGGGREGSRGGDGGRRERDGSGRRRDGSGDSGRGRGGDRGRKRGEKRASDEAAGFEAEQVTGTLDILPRGSGLIRGEGIPESGVYVSPSQIKRCELRAGDEVAGPVRAPRKGERRPSLTRVELVNGEPPDEERGTAFERLTPIEPSRRIPIRPDDDDVLARSVDLLAPLAFGQRILVEAQPRSGRTGFLRSLARSIRAGSEKPPEVTVLLVDERPEEVTAWKRETEGLSIEAAPADLGAKEQSRVAERVLSRVRREAEKGSDVVLMIDSLTRLSNALGDPGAIKPFFGTGRELEEESAGSVTVIATALTDAPGDREVIEAVRTTENSSIRLSAELAAAGVVPSIEVAGCSVTGEEKILSADEVAGLRALRAELAEMDAAGAANRLAESIRETASNEEVLAGGRKSGGWSPFRGGRRPGSRKARG
jgi:transcription termination factor Rho